MDISCTIKNLPESQAVEAAERAITINPTNRPSPGRFFRAISPLLTLMGIEPERDVPLTPDHLAVMTAKYWGSGGVKLTVGFLDNAPQDLQTRILLHMNAWGAYCNVHFALSSTDPQVRIARDADGYWSYLGPDILGIPRGQPTMNLEGFTMNTPESEFHRVVRHETGHTLGFPHEHMRQQLVSRLDRAKTILYFGQTQGWSQQTVIQQVLTPLSEASIRGTPTADQDSIMCYQLPGSITIDGQPIRGGVDIDPLDQAFAASLYPLVVTPPPPPPPPPPGSSGTLKVTLSADKRSATVTIV